LLVGQSDQKMGDVQIQLNEALRNVKLRIDSIGKRSDELEISIHKYFDEVVQQVEVERQKALEVLKQKRKLCNAALKKQCSLIERNLKDFVDEKKQPLTADSFFLLPMVEDSSWSIQGLPKLDTFVFNTKIKDVFLPPYSFSLNFENSYIDPVSKSAELNFDVRDINGDILEELQESGFSAIVEEPKNATVNIARKAVSQLCVT
jgi:hypothetical protein